MLLKQHAATLSGPGKRGRGIVLAKNIPYLLLALPAVVWLLLFHYLPIFGLVLAFKDYNYVDGILGSPWAGLENFKFFFESNDAFRIIRNTVGYNLLWLVLGNLIVGAIVALMLYEVRSKAANKIYQTSMLIPSFVSYVIIAYIVYLLLAPNSGILNQVLAQFGVEVDWYNEAKYWPFILTFFDIWRNVGMASLYYYAALLSIDPCLFEAASLDGASRFKQIWYISIPELKPMACIVLITKLGGVLGGNMDIFYQLTMNQGALYPTTDVIATYTYRGLTTGNIGNTAAVGLFQSVVGLILLLATNAIIRKISPDDALI